MIHIDRSPAPVFPLAWRPARRDTRSYFTDPKQNPSLYKFKAGVFVHPLIATPLLQLFHSKCAFCETPVPRPIETEDFASSILIDRGDPLSSSFSEVHHFRPKINAMNLQGVISPNHYWWLAYEWSNLYLSCGECSSQKGTRFPIQAASRAAPESPIKALAKERPLLLDPCADQPEEHLVFLPNGNVVSETVQGVTTIDVFGLNRTQLVRKRSTIYEQLEFAYASKIVELGRDGIRNDKSLRHELSENLLPHQPYTALRRQFIKQWLHEIGSSDWTEFLASASKKRKLVSAKQREVTSGKFAKRTKGHATYSVEKRKQREVYYSGAKRIEQIEIRNFKAIEHLVLKISPGQFEREPWMMLIGENGCGKSSILQGVGLALMGERHSNELGLDARRYVRAKARNGKGFVKVWLTNIPDPIELSFSRKSRRFSVVPKEPKVLLLGYGATRLLPHHTAETASRAKYIRIKNLFVPTAPLNDAETWLSNTKKVTRNSFLTVERALQELLMLQPNARFSRTRGVVKVKTVDGPVTLHDLSDGFQSVVAMCVDIMISMVERWKDMQVAEGIVLLDEIEGHLHPSWKIEIVERLRRCFPRVTFLATTHDPLCLKGLNDSEIVVLRRDESNRVRISTEVPEIEDLRADQILTSPHLFGLRSTIGKTPQAIDRYSELMKKRKKSEQDELEIEQLRLQLNKLFSSAETPLERQIENAVQQVLTQPGSPPASETSPATIEQIQPPTPDSEKLRLTIRHQLNRLLRK